MRQTDFAVILVFVIVFTSGNALATARHFSCDTDGNYSNQDNWLLASTSGLSCRWNQGGN